MSYEGYSQFLCKKGHYWTLDHSDTDLVTQDNKCGVCGCGAVWENMVDITNGSFEENKRIDGYIKLRVKKTRKCKHCGSVLERTYYKP